MDQIKKMTKNSLVTNVTGDTSKRDIPKNVDVTKRRSSVKQMQGMTEYIHNAVKETGNFPCNDVWDYLIANFNDKGPPKNRHKWRRTWGDLCRRTEARYREIEPCNDSDEKIKSLLSPLERKVIEVQEICNGFRGKYQRNNDILKTNIIKEDYELNEGEDEQDLRSMTNGACIENQDGLMEFYMEEGDSKEEEFPTGIVHSAPLPTVNVMNHETGQHFLSTDQEQNASSFKNDRSSLKTPRRNAQFKRIKFAQEQPKGKNFEGSMQNDIERKMYDEFGTFVANSIMNLPSSKLRVLAKHKVLQALMEVEVNALQALE